MHSFIHLQSAFFSKPQRKSRLNNVRRSVLFAIIRFVWIAKSPTTTKENSKWIILYFGAYAIRYLFCYVRYKVYLFFDETAHLIFVQWLLNHIKYLLMVFVFFIQAILYLICYVILRYNYERWYKNVQKQKYK